MCKQLGFPSAQGITEPNQFVSVQEDNIKVSITCVGDETTLTACNKTIIDFTTQCDIEPVGIICNTGERAQWLGISGINKRIQFKFDLQNGAFYYKWFKFADFHTSKYLLYFPS